jgi:hypothetical protein
VILANRHKSKRGIGQTDASTSMRTAPEGAEHPYFIFLSLLIPFVFIKKFVPLRN